MVGVSFKQFAQPQFLKAIGRHLLGRFFASFAADLAANNLTLPSPDLPDADYFPAVAGLFRFSGVVPDRLSGALVAIEDMATAEGQERLQWALDRAGIRTNPAEVHSPVQFGLEVWLAAASILIQEHQKHHPPRLAAFECFASRFLKTQRPPFTAPRQQALDFLAADLDAWFAYNDRGQRSTRVEAYTTGTLYCYLIRHADVLTWIHNARGHDTDSIQARPKRVDAVCYSTEHDELRITAATAGERELYREKFGILLRGSANYFSPATSFTLEPLRSDGADALDAHGVDAIRSVILQRVEADWCNAAPDLSATSATDFFRHACHRGGDPSGIPSGGKLVSATFLIEFADSPRRRVVQICLPNTLQLERLADSDTVISWMSQRRFKIDQTVHFARRRQLP